MYNSRSFEEEALKIYLQGMLDYESICEHLIMQKYDEIDYLQDLLDEAQMIFEERAK